VLDTSPSRVLLLLIRPLATALLTIRPTRTLLLLAGTPPATTLLLLSLRTLMLFLVHEHCSSAEEPRQAINLRRAAHDNKLPFFRMTSASTLECATTLVARFNQFEEAR
jgi:hypothetical protein